MKKRIWILLAGVLLLGVVIFLCLFPSHSPDAADPSLPSITQGLSPSRVPDADGTGASEPSLPIDANPSSAETREADQSGSSQTEAELPVDWNRDPTRDPTEAEPTDDSSAQASDAPGASSALESSSTPGIPSDSGEEPEIPVETGGQIVDPILPPDIFD